MYLGLNNLSKSFKDNKVVDNISLKVNEGEILCLLGPSGCGKTTTLKIMGGFLKPDCGKVILENEDITNLPAEERPISTVFQSYALFPHLNVIQNVIYGLKFKGYAKKDSLKKGEEYLDMVGLYESKNKKIQQLSGGEQQRVALARSLIINPKVLLLDEPLSNLDAKLRIKMRKDIREIQSKFNTTMIFVTHDQEEALGIGDKIGIMDEGKLEQIGTPQEIYNNPANSFVLNFLGNSNTLEKQGKNISFVRPEHVIINKTSGEVKGKILWKNFMGSYNLYSIKVGDKEFTAKVQDFGKNDLQIGEEVFLTFSHKGSCIEK